MKTILRLSIAALGLAIFSLSAFVAQAQFYYQTNNGTITITGGCPSSPGAVTIPETINGLPVTSIGDYAFYGCTNLTSITIPNRVTSIGDYAFYGCASLTAFEVDPANPSYSSLDGVLFNKSRSEVIQYPSRKAGSYSIPNSVTRIGGAAFSGCTSLTSITIPNSVTTIWDYAFSGCTSLTNVVIGKSVTTIGRRFPDFDRGGAFRGCTSLTSITIPNSVTSIGMGAFEGCTSLSNVVILNGSASIGPCAFSGCDKLDYARIGSGAMLFRRGPCPGGVVTIQATIAGLPVTHLGDEMFSGCTSLTSVTIPNSVTSIRGGAFWGCTSLTNITIPNSVTSIETAWFSAATPIGAFRGCTSLTSITIPNNVISIGQQAFKGCTSLKGAYFQGNVPSVGWEPFYGATNVTVYYLPVTTGWGSTFAGRPTAPWVLPYPVILTAPPNFGLQTNGFGFRISWATNVTIVIEAATTLANPVWSPVSTNALTDGWSDFSEAEWMNQPARFYRVRAQ